MEDYILLKTDKQTVEKRQFILCKTLLSRYLNLQKEHTKLKSTHIEKLEKLQNKIKESKPREIKKDIIPVPIPQALRLEAPQPTSKVEILKLDLPKIELPKPAPKEELPLITPTIDLKSKEPIELQTRPFTQEEISLINSETRKFSSKLSEGNLEKQGDIYTYKVKEPEINLEVLDKVEQNLNEKLQKDSSLVTNQKFIKNEIIRAFKQLRENYTLEDIYNTRYYLIRNYIGLGKIEPLLCDKNIISIQSDGVNKPITVMYKSLNQKIKTNITFKTKEELESFIESIAERTNQEISEGNPVLNASLSDLKVQAILSTGVLEPKFTISKITS